MDIGELARAHIGDDGTGVAISDVEELAIKLEPLEKAVLITAASPYYQRDFRPHVVNTLSIDKYKYGKIIKSIRRKLDVSDEQPLISALCIALKKGLVSTEEILDGKNMEEELPRFKVRLRRLTRPGKGVMAEIYNYAIEHHGVTNEEISEISQYAFGFRGTKNLGISNRAQLAFFAHIYMHFMHNQAEEQLTGKQLDVLEQLVIKTGTNRVYRSSQALTRRYTEALNVQTSMEAVLKALDMGFYSLLLEVDIPAFVALDTVTIDFLKTALDGVALTRNHNIRTHIYKQLGIHSRSQLAPYLFLAAKLDENEMELLRHISPDEDQMRIVYEKFGMPRDAYLLAPSKYLAVKHGMAAKN